MKDYKSVVRERYDQEAFDRQAIADNMYSLINPVGFYGEYNSVKILTHFINLLDAHRGEHDDISLLDCGCGVGLKTRIMAELIGSPTSVYGTDYSVNSIEHCKMMNSNINYHWGDITKEIPFDVKFDAITAFVVFMHFSKEDEVKNALSNIYDSLKEDGLFLWYDTNVKSHWDSKERADGWGYSVKEMDKYAKEAGFRFVSGYGLYSIIPGLKTSTVYLSEQIKQMWLLDILDKMPFKKNNNVRIYMKDIF